MDTQYRNLLNTPITAQQVALGGSYYKDYLINGTVKKTEECLGSSVIRVTYYKDANEQDNQIIAFYNNSDTVQAFFIRERTSYGTYQIETENTYLRNEQSGNFEVQPVLVKWLYNANGDQVAYESFQTDLPSTDPDYRSIKKYYYFGAATEGDERPYFISIFDENENFECLHYVPDPSLIDEQDIQEYNLADALVWMTQIGIPQNLQNWYVASVFLPPI